MLVKTVFHRVVWMVVAMSLPLVARTAGADVFTVGSFTWDHNDAATTAMLVEGAIEFTSPNSEFLVPASDAVKSRTIGRLVGTPFGGSVHATFPLSGGGSPEPNVDRATIELTWGGGTLSNVAGNDFVVYESTSSPDFVPEAFVVSVHMTGGSFTSFRYEFSDANDATHEARATAFDLSDFGLSLGTTIDAVRIRNVFNASASAGADRVDDMSGQGNVLYPGDAGYPGGFTLLTAAFGTAYATAELDADPILLVGLHAVDYPPPPPSGEVPEPSSLLLAVIGLASLSGYGWRTRLRVNRA